MKIPTPFKNIACLLTLLASSGITQAADIILTNSDALNNSSFTNKGFWNSSSAPFAGNNYLTWTNGMRTPQNAFSYTFAGDSLTLSPGALPTRNGYSLLEAATAAKTLTVNNFTNAGGIMRSRGGHTFAVTWAGNKYHVASNSAIWADQNGWIITSPLSGPDNVVLTNSPTAAQAQDTIAYQGTNTLFTGTLLLNGGITKFQNLFSAPGNPATFNARQFTLNANATLQDEVGLSLTNSNGGITLGGAATINTFSNTLISEPIAGAFTLTKSGSGTLTLSGSNTMTGMILSGATVGSRLNINSTNALGVGTFIIQSGDNATIDNTSGSSITLLANNALTWNNNFTFAGSNPLHLGNGNVAMAANRTLTINNSTLTVGGIISGAGSLNKVGGGTLALGGANTYSGNTTINGGSLVLNSGASILNSPTISVAAGTTFDVSATSFTLGTTNTLSGSGTVNGSLADSAGSLILPGGSGAIGTLTVTTNLTLAGGDTLRFDFATGSNDLITVGGNLTPNGNTAISLGNLPTVLPSGTYTLIQVAGSLGGSAANFYVTNQPTPSRQAFSIAYATSPNRVQLVVTADSAALEWLGTSVDWDLLITSDWTNAATASADIFYNGDAVSFTDLGVAAQPVLNTNVSPGAVTFNSTGNYLLSGTGAINGGGGLTKAGSSTLTITTTNGYTGATAINGGIVSVNMFTNAGVAQPLGASSASSANLSFNNGTLQYTGDTSSSTRGATINSGGGTVEIVNGATTLAVNGAIAGSSGGSLTKIGNGTLVLGGANSYNGSTLVNVGTLSSTNDAIPSGSAVVLADATGVNLNLLGNDTVGSIAGGGLNGGNINLNARTLTYGSDNNSTTFAGLIFGTGGITKVGTGTNTLTGVNTFSGNFFIKNGAVVVDTGGGIATTLWQSIGQDTGDNATLTLKGSGSVSQTTSDFNVGDIGNSIGTLNIQDSASLNVNAFYVGSANAAGSTASGTVNQTGGSVTENSVATGAFLLGGRNSALGVGIYNLSGGTLTAAGGLRVGSAGTGIFNQSGGLFNANGGVNIARLAGSSGTYNLDGGTVITLNITSSTGSNAVFNLNGGTVQPTATANNTTWINNLTVANVRTNATTIDNLGYNVTITQPLVHSTIGGDAAIDAGLIFQGSGTNTLTATNTYNGPTIVNSGVLNLNGVLGTGPVTVNGGATIIGIGTLNGATTNISGTIAPAGPGIGTLTINNKLAIQGGNLYFNMTKTSNDVIAVSGALSIEAATTAYVSFPAPSIGTNTLITYGSFPNPADLANLTLSLTSPNPRYTYSLSNDVAASAIKLVVSGNTNSQGNLVWRGDGSFNGWDNTGIYQNWTNAAQGALDYFYDGDIATFDNTGSTTPSVSITAPVAPSAVNVASTSTYDFTGSAISSPGNLTKSSSGSLILENDNTFANASLNGGVIQIGNGGPSGSLNTATITNNGSIVFNRSDAANMSAAISGSGEVQQISAGSAVLSGSNSYAGVTLVNAGILYPHNVTALGSAAGNTVATNGGKLYFDQNFDIADENFVFGGTAVQKGGAGVTTLGGTIALVADTTFVLDGGATLNLTNTTGITASGSSLTVDGGGNTTLTGPLALGAGSLTKLGGGVLTVGTNNSFTGIATITAGTLNVTDATLGNPAVFTPNQITLNGGTFGNIASIAFTNGKSGMTVAANSTNNVAAGTTMLFSNEITGSASLTKSGAGTLILGASNSFNGTLNLDTFSFGANDGAVRITTSNAIAFVASPINSRNNNGGSSILQLDGTSGNISVAQNFVVNCRNSGVAWIQNMAGNNQLTGLIQTFEGGGSLPFQSDAGQLEIVNNIQYSGSATAARTYNFIGNGNHLITGVILNGDNGAIINITKSGTGTATLAAANAYVGSTAVSAGTLLVSGSINSTNGVTVTGGTLAGTGSIADTVTVSGAGNLAPGANAIGTLTINSNLTLSGLTTIEVNKTAGTRDQVVGITRVNYGGTLFATNLSGTLNVGDNFAIFSAATRTNNFATITGSPGAGKAWSFNPTNGVLSVVVGVNTTPTNLVAKVNGNSLELSWPADHIGWRLQAQTNNLATGLNTNWVDVAGSSSVNSVTNIINPASGSVFYRMVYP